MYNQGISKSGDVLDIAVEEGIVEKRGAFYSYGDQRLAQGRENAKTYLEANPDLMTLIENKVREIKGLGALGSGTLIPATSRPRPMDLSPKSKNGSDSKPISSEDEGGELGLGLEEEMAEMEFAEA
jgi:hypothetical protein